LEEVPLAPRIAEQLRLLVDAVADYAIFLLDREGRILTWNAGARRIKGYRADEIVGQHFSVFYTEEDRANEHPAHELEIAERDGHYEEEGWRIRRDGSRFWANVIITALFDDRGRLVGFGKVTRDLTARRLGEEQLRARSAELTTAAAELAQFQMLVSHIRDYAIFLLDAGGYVRTWNAGAELIKGYSEAEILGQHFSRFYPPEDVARGHPARELEIAAREGRFEEEGWRMRKDGSRFWANVVLTALRNDHGILVGYAKVTRDLTTRRAAEEELRRTAAELERSNAELDRFAAAAAHDLAEPLHTIAGLADLIERRHGDSLDPEAREALGHIRGGAVRLRGLLDGLLAYSRASHGEMHRERVEVAAALAHVLDSLGARIEERGAHIDYDPTALGAVMADGRLLETVLQNLVTNALKFAESEPPHVEVRAAATDGAWRLTVSDNGIGIAPEHQERVFGLFSRLHPSERYPGTGLGLALCRRIVERHGGEMGVESVPGAGSRFWFTLPAA
jgi:PAS domain S-box-containing protein